MMHERPAGLDWADIAGGSGPWMDEVGFARRVSRMYGAHCPERGCLHEHGPLPESDSAGWVLSCIMKSLLMHCASVVEWVAQGKCSS